MFKRMIDATPEEGRVLRAEYYRRKRLTHQLASGWMLYFVLIFWTPLVEGARLSYLLIGGFVVFSVMSRTWRCPRCGKGFGERWRVHVCPGCRLVLEAERPT